MGVTDRRAATRGDAWTDPDLAATAADLRRIYGLELGPSRIASAEDAMWRVMRNLGIASPKVLRDRAGHSAELQDALIAELTIGETYFFREPGQLDFLATRLLPEMARDAAPLRMWSAGCSTGEEPYSLAMLLRERGWAHGATILGTDLVPARLAHARRGRYGKWSMRGVSEATIARWFRTQGRAFVLDDTIRKDVDFRVLDLACDDYATVGAAGIDVVFCRNVLIYFDIPTIRRVAEKLLATLSPRGWLFLSATDPVLSDLVACEAVPTGAGFAYRNGGSRPVAAQRASSTRSRPLAEESASASGARLLGEERASASGARPLSAERVSPTGARPAARRAPRAVTPVVATPSIGADAQSEKDAQSDEEADIVRVRGLANRGALEEAGQACLAALDRHPMSARLETLHATLLLQGGRPGDAAAAARRSLYLDRRAPVAHLILGDALARAGDAAGASRAFRNAAALLARLPSDAPVPDADGEPAGRLAEMAKHRASVGSG